MQTARKLWEPSREFAGNSNLTHFFQWLATKGVQHNGYHDAWTWSVQDFETFWTLLLEYFDVQYEGTVQNVLSQRTMPGIRWFPGIRLNYAEHIIRNETLERPAIIFCDEAGKQESISWGALRQQVASLQEFLKSCGVVKGDRVAAYLPNIPEASIGFLAVAALGSIWSSCSPDFGTQSVVDRFDQIKPKILLATASYTYGGKHFDKGTTINELAAAIPSIEKVILINQSPTASKEFVPWSAVMERKGPTLTFERVEFNEPLWVLYSSGTTGLPKAITHSHGGVLLEQLKYLSFHQDVHPGDRCFWFTTTGWMMWNYLQGALLCGATIVLYDGSPVYPNTSVLWNMAEQARVQHFGTSAGFILSCMKSGVNPSQEFDLSALTSIGSTGSTLPEEGFDWIYRNVKKDLWLTSMSGGTDVASAFVGGNPLWPVYAGEIQCRALGCGLEAWDENGRPLMEEEGEMVVTQPMPCMPIYFWNDPQLSKYNDSYFNVYPGIWRHGDWIKLTSREGIVIYGRSDATLNKGGVRIGTSEIYRALDKVPEVSDSLIICVEKPGGEFYMPLFVALKEKNSLTNELKKKINQVLRSECSPRHVPDEILEAPEIPYTISGKKTETPVKKILMGKDPLKVISRGSLRNPQSLDFFVNFHNDQEKK